MISSIHAGFLSRDLHLSMWIPAELAGLVVGKKRTTISNIQQETKTTLLEAKKPFNNSLWSAVIIHGDKQHVKMAYDAIADIVDRKNPL